MSLYPDHAWYYLGDGPPRTGRPSRMSERRRLDLREFFSYAPPIRLPAPAPSSGGATDAAGDGQR